MHGPDMLILHLSVLVENLQHSNGMEFDFCFLGLVKFMLQSLSGCRDFADPLPHTTCLSVYVCPANACISASEIAYATD